MGALSGYQGINHCSRALHGNGMISQFPWLLAATLDQLEAFGHGFLVCACQRHFEYIEEAEKAESLKPLRDQKRFMPAHCCIARS